MSFPFTFNVMTSLALKNEIMESLLMEIKENYWASYLSLVKGPLTQNEVLNTMSPQELEMITTQLEKIPWLMNPFQSIRGLPSFFSPLNLSKYHSMLGSSVAQYLIFQRFPHEHPSAVRQLNVYMHLSFTTTPETTSKFEFKCDPTAPLASLAYQGLIQQILQEFAHMFRGKSHETEFFRSIVGKYLLPSPLAAGDLFDQSTLFQQYAEAIYCAKQARYHGDFGENETDFEVMWQVSEILYNSRHPEYQKLGPQLDTFRVNWRAIPSIVKLNKCSNKPEEVSVTEIIKRVRTYLSERIAVLYEPGTPRAKEIINTNERKAGVLTLEQDHCSLQELQEKVAKWTHQASDQQIWAVLNQYRELLNYDQEDCLAYTREQLVEAMDQLGAYLPKSNLWKILGVDIQ